MSSNKFNCADCGVNTKENGEYYMVHDKIYHSVAKDNEMLCIGCLEKRLGRRLHKRDFTDYPINNKDLDKKSKRFLNRICKGE